MPDEDPRPAPPAGEASPAPEESASKLRLTEAKLEQVIEAYHALRTENASLRERLQEIQTAYQVTTQDIGAAMERQKRLAARELRSERETIYSRYIEILDNFDRAFDTAEARAASHSLMEGFILVRNQVVQVLRDGGFDRVRTLGLPYDPNTSEAIQMEEVEDPAQDGLVIRELVRGYRLDAHIVRAARVVVGRYTNPEGAETSETVRVSEEISRAPREPGENPGLEEAAAKEAPPKKDSEQDQS
jgi:molecular chaperone GrpE